MAERVRKGRREGLYSEVTKGREGFYAEVTKGREGLYAEVREGREGLYVKVRKDREGLYAKVRNGGTLVQKSPTQIAFRRNSKQHLNQSRI